MEYYVLTLFPDMIAQGLGTSITGRAIRNRTIGLHPINIRDFSTDKHRRVDDYTYGGGAGMLMQPQPVYDAWEAAKRQIPEGHKMRTIYVTPQGRPFTQKIARDLAVADDLIFLCGHYEGIDERVLEETVTDYISIGDYVLTGGELAAMVMIDAISRLVPGVLHNEVSAETESFHGSLLEYPQYSRPEEWHGRKVPEVLLSGNQKQVDKWRLEQQEIRTRERRPDLYAEYRKLQDARSRLVKSKLLHMDMISRIDCGRAELPVPEMSNGSILMRDEITGEYLLSTGNQEAFDSKRIADYLCGEKTSNRLVLHSKEDAECLSAYLQQTMGIGNRVEEMLQAVLTRREKLPVTGLYRPDGKPTAAGITIRQAEGSGLRFTAYADGIPVGTIALAQDGSMTGLYVEEAYRRRHIGTALLTCMCNRLLEENCVPYGRFAAEEDVIRLLEKTGLYIAASPIFILQIQ